MGPPARPAAAGFEALFATEYPQVVGVAWRVLLERSAAEDVAQEVFLAFHLRHPRGHQAATGWLRLAAAHLALNRLRGDRRRARRELGWGPEPAGGDNPEAVVVADEARLQVRRALARIKPKSAALLMLRYSGLSYAEVAQALSIPVTQVGVRLRRAEVALRKEVERDDPAASS
ncbi:MAG: sigma-70 family RNA polymerase sigma factor [Candidatus Dormibacteria bacterium]